jgi:cysteine desulfurase/selenocysteine lyase
LLQKLRQIPALEFAPGIGVCDCTRGFGIISFRIEGVASADVGAYLDSENIFVRTGDFCLGRQSGEDEFVRISLHVYNTHEEIDRLTEVLQDAVLY